MIALAVALATVQFRFLSFLAISFVVTWLKALGASRKKDVDEQPLPGNCALLESYNA